MFSASGLPRPANGRVWAFNNQVLHSRNTLHKAENVKRLLAVSDINVSLTIRWSSAARNVCWSETISTEAKRVATKGW
eukprot:15447815-Alexandrium_andersonii.AAC.1